MDISIRKDPCKYSQMEKMELIITLSIRMKFKPKNI